MSIVGGIKKDVKDVRMSTVPKKKEEDRFCFKH